MTRITVLGALLFFSINLCAQSETPTGNEKVIIFSDEVRSQQPSPVYNFLEQIITEHKYNLSENPLRFIKLTFLHGSWTELEQVNPSDACTITNHDNKQYEVSWIRNGETFVSVSFPIDYELLSNNTRRKMEREFVMQLSTFFSEDTPSFSIDESDLIQIDKENMYALFGDTLLLPIISNTTYFQLDSVKDSRIFNVVCDSLYPKETMANLLLNTFGKTSDVPLSLTVKMSDFNTRNINTTLQEWNVFCINKGCKPFYMFEAEYEKDYAAMQLMYNPEYGYAHVAVFRFPRKKFSTKTICASGNVYLYVPLNNISKLLDKKI